MNKKRELLVLLLIMTVAVGFRLYGLHDTPPGLYPDEAMNGNDAIQAIDSGHPQVFYPNNNGREGLFINLQSLSIRMLGNTAFALRIVSAIIGILTVLGTYLLTRKLFDNWEIAAIAAFLMAVGFWHVNFSRLGFRTIMAPFCAVWALYYLYSALTTMRLWPWLVAGFWLGLGFHTYIAFRVMPAVVAVIIGFYLFSLRNKFQHDKFAHTRNQLIGGMAVMAAVMIIVLLPMAAYFYANPGEFSDRASQLSVFATDHPLTQFAINYGKTLGMFMFHGDENWRHNFAGQPLLAWPIAAFFAIGFLRSLYKILRTSRTHGHPSVIHVVLLSWLLIGIVPAAVSNEGIPHALRSMLVAPAAYIIAAQGVWWFYTWLLHWYHQRDLHKVCVPGPNGHRYCVGEGTLVVTIALVAFLGSVGFSEAVRYFVQWGTSPVTAAYFNQNYVDIANRINQLPPSMIKYVVVGDTGIKANGFPIAAETVMYLTNTSTSEKQNKKHLHYITERQFLRGQYTKGAFVIKLDQ